MKQTILSNKQSVLLEELLVSHGHVVTTKDIFGKATGLWSETQVKNIITKLVADGWLIRIKRGVFAISDLSSRGFLTLSPFVVANLLVAESYVSFESALGYYGLFDQLTERVISISQVRYKTTRLDITEYSFVHVQEKWFFGWQEVVIDTKNVHIATAEKALIDMVQFHKSKYSVDIVIEKLRSSQENLNIERLQEYLAHMSSSTIKIFGLLFDLLDINSDEIYSSLTNKRGADYMFAGDKTFNAKWRLYYDEYFEKYKKS